MVLLAVAARAWGFTTTGHSSVFRLHSGGASALCASANNLVAGGNKVTWRDDQEEGGSGRRREGENDGRLCILMHCHVWQTQAYAYYVDCDRFVVFTYAVMSDE